MSDVNSTPPPPPPPPPPPQAAPKEPGKTNPLLYLGGIALLVVAAIPAFFLNPDGGVNTTSYRVGRVIGSMVFGLVVGYFLWWLFRRSSQRSLPKWSPWVLVIAAGITLFAQIPSFVRAAAQAPNIEATEQEQAPAHQGPAARFFIEPAGYEYRQLAPQVMEELRAQFASEPDAAEAIAEFDGRQIVANRAPAGATIVMLMNAPPDSWDETHAGFVRGFEDSAGTQLESTTVGGADALTASTQEGVFIFLLDRNLVIEVFAFDEDTARDVAEAQAAVLTDRVGASPAE